MTPPSPEFDTVLRGYDRHTVDSLVRRALAALDGDRDTPVTADELRTPRIAVVLRGYDRTQVEDYLRELAAALSGAAGTEDLESIELDVVLRGCDRVQVEEVFALALATLRDPGGAPRISSGELRAARFDTVLRGYDHRQVAKALNSLVDRLDAAESRKGRG
ncbi:DivIVA domain-containing protein [Nocardiopsis sp. CNT312]|uniref:DivIVA domain-containing protein n=1 Tax=Nocardiopsis sp. CNT312 TaxID=1137268 RepID=UPI0004AFA8BA|nr:DivIVA domain-containing protein [Nocardiopsis sp. CNT312]